MTADQGNRYPAPAVFFSTAFNETVMLARIGSDLRDLYGDVEDAPLPRDLLLLASRIDETRQTKNGSKTGT
jgi:hypothetical protein